MPETRSGSLTGRAARLRKLAEGARAILLGPGMEEDGAITALVRALVGAAGPETVLVLDAGGLAALRGKSAGRLARLAGQAVLTPHAGEMAALLGRDKSAIRRARRGTPRRSSEPSS